MSQQENRTVLTGAGGFLGFHTRALLKSREQHVDVLPLGAEYDADLARKTLDGAQRLVHIAGVNRGSDNDIYEGNVAFSRQLAESIAACENPPAEVSFANSIQAGNETVYGQAKAEAASHLGWAVAAAGVKFIDLALPNLFGEHGRPFYNSVTSTFCHLLASKETPEVHQDRLLSLMHAQHAAELLVGDHASVPISEFIVERSVTQLLQQLSVFAEVYRGGIIPLLNSGFERDLFNTYRSYLSPETRVIELSRHADQRGSFFEVVKSQGGSSQTSFSTTVPGVVRGQHYHVRKIERFSVISGTGTIAMRRLWDNKVLTYNVDGTRPVAIDMPTLWAHNITNSGSGVMHTAFWTNELFDPEAPDTFAEIV